MQCSKYRGGGKVESSHILLHPKLTRCAWDWKSPKPDNLMWTKNPFYVGLRSKVSVNKMPYKYLSGGPCLLVLCSASGSVWPCPSLRWPAQSNKYKLYILRSSYDKAGMTTFNHCIITMEPPWQYPVHAWYLWHSLFSSTSSVYFVINL